MTRREVEAAYAAAHRWMEVAVVREHRLHPRSIEAMVDWALAAAEGIRNEEASKALACKEHP